MPILPYNDTIIDFCQMLKNYVFSLIPKTLTSRGLTDQKNYFKEQCYVFLTVFNVTFQKIYSLLGKLWVTLHRNDVENFHFSLSVRSQNSSNFCHLLKILLEYDLSTKNSFLHNFVILVQCKKKIITMFYDREC